MRFDTLHRTMTRFAKFATISCFLLASGLPEILAAPKMMQSPAQPAGAPKPYGATPTEPQVQWQRMEFYAFIHFGLNTYTNREWGYGDENPKLFNPKNFNAQKIVKTFKEGGMKGMIYTAKHHDGFCAWQTKSTEHSIKQSPWKNGRGDIVKEFAEACEKEEIKFGTYLSPWDRNCKDYGNAGYLKVYYKQIEELLTNYGPVFEMWFDGANGGDGYYGGAREKRNIGNAEKYYNFEQIVKNIRAIQPNCIVWGAGHYGDARWGGSEKGHVNYPHWSTVDSKKGGGRGTGYRNGDRWVPAEGDTTINHAGWFWHPGQAGRVKSPEHLLKVWFESVGRGANLILNVAANRDGELDPADVVSLMKFKALRDELYATDFALKAKSGSASNVRKNDKKKFGVAKLVDGNPDTYWATDDNKTEASAEITLVKKSTFDVVRVREEIRLGQRVEGWALDAWLNGKWEEVVVGSSIGNQAMLKFPAGAVTTDRVRLRITKSPACPCISELSLFKMPETVDSSTTAKLTGIKKNKWKIVSAPAGSVAKNAIDGDPKTFWHTHMKQELRPPQSIVVDMGETLSVKGFSYLPRQDGRTNGMTSRYVFELSEDGKKWTKVSEGEFGNLRANPVEQVVDFAQRKARYFRFTGTAALDKNHISAAEIGILADNAK